MRLGGGPEKNFPTGGAPNSRHLPCTPGANTPGPWLSRSWPGGPVKAADYDTVAGALLGTLEQALGSEFTPAMRDAWVAYYQTLAGEMKAAAPV